MGKTFSLIRFLVCVFFLQVNPVRNSYKNKTNKSIYAGLTYSTIYLSDSITLK